MTKSERDSTISIKVSQEERELLKTRALNLKMNISNFIRFATLSGSEESISIIAENSRLNKKLREIETKQTFNGVNLEEAAIVLPCTQEQKELILQLYGNSYSDGREPSVQILNYLIEDAITPHWYFAGSTLSPDRDYPSHLTKLGVKNIPLNIQRRSYVAQFANITLARIQDVFNEFILEPTQEDIEELNKL